MRFIAADNQDGYVILLSVVLVGAVGASIASALLLLSLGASRTSLAEQEALAARAAADGCVEEAVMRLTDDDTYAGGTTITIDANSCEIVTITGTGPTDRTIQSTSTVGDSTIRIEAHVDSLDPAVVDSWERVESF